jgi:hypothetical protein
MSQSMRTQQETVQDTTGVSTGANAGHAQAVAQEGGHQTNMQDAVQGMHGNAAATPQKKKEFLSRNGCQRVLTVLLTCSIHQIPFLSESAPSKSFLYCNSPENTFETGLFIQKRNGSVRARYTLSLLATVKFHSLKEFLDSFV